MLLNGTTTVLVGINKVIQLQLSRAGRKGEIGVEKMIERTDL